MSREARSDRTHGSRHRYWIPGTVFALGLVSIAMLAGTNWIRERLMIQGVALVHAVGEIQARQAMAHLWLEEYVSGDEVHREEAAVNRDRASYLVDTILEGGEVSDGRYALEPLRDPALRARALAIRRLVEDFRRIAESRQRGYARGEDVGIGSEIDEEYDRVFREMIESLGGLQTAVDDHLDRAHARSLLLFRTILIAWVTIVTLAVTGLWNRERRRLLAERALRESEERLLRSQKMEALGRLAGGLAHDINNYLAAITSQCEVAKLKPGSREEHDARLDAVIATASRAAALIRRLLAFGRRQTVQPRVVSLDRVVADLQGMLRRLVGESVELELSLADEPWNTRIDPSQLEQLVVNLVVNAKEAMPEGGAIRIRIANLRVGSGEGSGGMDVGPGEYVTLAVSDTGSGIDTSVRDEIFEPFVTTKDAATNSGLGLATVYGIVKEAGGGIRVDSAPGRGTEFEILLPRVRASEERPGARSVAAAVGGSQRILLVEDNDDLRISTGAALEALGYTVVLASTGSEALERFDDAVDLVVTDVVMPGMNGRDMVERMRSGRGDLRVIYMSGYTDDVVLRHGIREDEVDFLAKPFLVADLARKIREVLDRGDGAASGRSVLLIDDEDTLRGSVKLLLESHGMSVLTAAAGREGLGLFRDRAGDIGCVLLDLTLPDLDGEGVLREIRTLRPDLPVLVLSGRVDGIRDRLAEDGTTAVLSKPFDAGTLADAVAGALRSGRLPPRPGGPPRAVGNP